MSRHGGHSSSSGGRDRDRERNDRDSDLNDCRIYVGNLPRDIRVRDLQDLFDEFGKISYIDLKTKYSVPFAFVDYEDPRDARDAVRKRNHYEMEGYPLVVEQPRGKSYQERGDRDHRGGYGGRRGFGGGGGFVNRRSGYDDRRRGGGISYRGGGGGGGRYDDDDGGPPRPRFQVGFHVKITGLPTSTSWQDLKDFMREAGEVGYTDIRRGSGTAIVQFHRLDDMKYAIKKFDDYEFTSSKGDKATIRVCEEDTTKSPRRAVGSRSPSRSRSRSPIRRRKAESRSRSRSVSKSPVRQGREVSRSVTPPPASSKRSPLRRSSFTPDGTPPKKRRGRSRSPSSSPLHSPARAKN